MPLPRDWPPDAHWKEGPKDIGNLVPLLFFLVIFVSGILRAIFGRALGSLATGGMFVGGGIAPRNLPLLRDGFFSAFSAKGRFATLLARIPIKVVLGGSDHAPAWVVLK